MSDAVAKRKYTYPTFMLWMTYSPMLIALIVTLICEAYISSNPPDYTIMELKMKPWEYYPARLFRPAYERRNQSLAEVDYWSFLSYDTLLFNSTGFCASHTQEWISAGPHWCVKIDWITEEFPKNFLFEARTNFAPYKGVDVHSIDDIMPIPTFSEGDVGLVKSMVSLDKIKECAAPVLTAISLFLVLGSATLATILPTQEKGIEKLFRCGVFLYAFKVLLTVVTTLFQAFILTTKTFHGHVGKEFLQLGFTLNNGMTVSYGWYAVGVCIFSVILCFKETPRLLVRISVLTPQILDQKALSKESRDIV